MLLDDSVVAVVVLITPGLSYTVFESCMVVVYLDVTMLATRDDTLDFPHWLTRLSMLILLQHFLNLFLHLWNLKSQMSSLCRLKRRTFNML